MKVNIEKLVSEARASLEKTGDNRYWCRTDEIRALLKARATPININKELIGKTYVQRVSYEGIIFINITDAPVRKFKKYSKNK